MTSKERGRARGRWRAEGGGFPGAPLITLPGNQSSVPVQRAGPEERGFINRRLRAAGPGGVI